MTVRGDVRKFRPGISLHSAVVPRGRSARSAALGVTVRRTPTTTLSSRSGGPLRRRLAVGCLVLLSLILITMSFRSGEDGQLSGVHSAGATVLKPFAVGFERSHSRSATRTSGRTACSSARSEAERLRIENRELRQRAIQSEFALQENEYLRALQDYIDGPRFPDDFEPISAEVIGRPAGAFTQAIVIAAGSRNGVRLNDPVVTADGLVGLVTRITPGTARVQLLTDQGAAVSAVNLPTRAEGIVRHARGTRETLVLDRVRKQDVIKVGDDVVTAGWRASGLSSLYPKGIPIGEVSSVGQTDTDLFQQVQVDPYVDFGSLDAVARARAPERRVDDRRSDRARVGRRVRRGHAAGGHRLVARHRRRSARPSAHRRDLARDCCGDRSPARSTASRAVSSSIS